MTSPTRSTSEAAGLRPARVCFVQTLALLLLGLTPLPFGWAWARSALDSVRSPELSKADRESAGGGYYEGLIGHGDGPQGVRNELALRLLGKPADWGRFHAANVCQSLEN